MNIADVIIDFLYLAFYNFDTLDDNLVSNVRFSPVVSK